MPVFHLISLHFLKNERYFIVYCIRRIFYRKRGYTEAQLRPYYACMQRELRGTRCAVTRMRFGHQRGAGGKARGACERAEPSS